MGRIVISVDDTDDVSKATSTGAVAEAIAYQVRGLGGLIELEITRHQLLLDESVPYTSHNSAMALVARVADEAMDDIWDLSCNCVNGMMAESANPGLCLMCIPEEDDDDVQRLISYGYRCKEQFVSKSEAYQLASGIPWVRLEELGGDGQGVVGALAGAALRLSGNDGRFRGKWDLNSVVKGDTASAMGNRRGLGKGSGRHKGQKHRHTQKETEQGGSVGTSTSASYSVAEVCEGFSRILLGRFCVVDSEGRQLPDGARIIADSEVKPMLYGGRLAVVVKEAGDAYAPCSKADLDELHGDFADMDRSCSLFESDNDREEDLRSSDRPLCVNCLYRRWTSSGFACMRVPSTPSFSQVMK